MASCDFSTIVWKRPSVPQELPRGSHIRDTFSLPVFLSFSLFRLDYRSVRDPVAIPCSPVVSHRSFPFINVLYRSSSSSLRTRSPFPAASRCLFLREKSAACDNNPFVFLASSAEFSFSGSPCNVLLFKSHLSLFLRSLSPLYLLTSFICLYFGFSPFSWICPRKA